MADKPGPLEDTLTKVLNVHELPEFLNQPKWKFLANTKEVRYVVIPEKPDFRDLGSDFVNIRRIDCCTCCKREY